MQKITVHAPGSYDRLRIESAADPMPGPGEVRVRVAHAGVNYADCIVRMGLYESARRYVGWPITPGFEVAGVVDAVGEPGEAGAVLRPGTAVLAVTRFGGYASHVAVPRHQVFPIPAGWSSAQAAGFPAVALTAHYALRVLVAPRPGAQLLVHSAAGGVGSALCQLGRAAGCRITAVVGGPHKVAAAERAGAHHVIDKSSTALWPAARAAAPDGYDAVFDANGVATLRQSYAHLAPTGRLVIYGFHSMLPHDGRLNWLRLAWDWLRTPRFNPLDMTQSNRSVLAANLSFLQSEAPRLREGMRWLMQRFESRELQPLPVETFPLERAADAQRRIESGQSIGKIALLP